MSENQPIQIDQFLEENGTIDNQGRGLFYNQDKPASEFTHPFENKRITQPDATINHMQRRYLKPTSLTPDRISGHVSR